MGLHLDVGLDGARWERRLDRKVYYQLFMRCSHQRVLHERVVSNVCSTAFIFECTDGTGRLIGSFPETTVLANAYQGELLGLMAIHLILRSINEMALALSGLVMIISEFLGAIGGVEHLPPHRIPSRCKHSKIKIYILVICSDLTFQRVFEHVDAHQDYRGLYESLTQPEQLK